MTERPEGPDEGLREMVAAVVFSGLHDGMNADAIAAAILRLPLLTAERGYRRGHEACERAIESGHNENAALRERADRLAQVIEQAESPESIERAAREAFWTDDMGGHVKGRWTWETIPEVGRENFRTLVRAVIHTALSRTATEGDDRD